MGRVTPCGRGLTRMPFPPPATRTETYLSTDARSDSIIGVLGHWRGVENAWMSSVSPWSVSVGRRAEREARLAVSVSRQAKAEAVLDGSW